MLMAHVHVLYMFYDLPTSYFVVLSIIIMAISIRFIKKKNESAKTRSANNVKKAT